jgi:UDP-MurNAc hydroxylase
MGMLITYLGHAGFCVETSKSIIAMDPWLSPQGAFDSAWFQFPSNHHLAALVQEKLQQAKDAYVYISHEHKDHFDLAFLNSLVGRDFTLIVPHFRRPALREQLADYRCRGMITANHGQRLSLSDGRVTLYLDDSELDRDSAILVESEGRSFLNMNDCKLHDQLARIREEHGKIDVFACQFSGATWHPVCYGYPEELYQRIARKKMMGKFESTAKAIEAISPRMYLPSAGPCCFLDPTLFGINFQPVNTFPRAPKFLAYLEKRLRRSHPVHAPELMPGDVVDAATADFRYRVPDRLSEDDVDDYLRSYAAKYRAYFDERRSRYPADQVSLITDRLREELKRKLQAFTLSERLDRCLYVGFQDAPDELLRVDFRGRTVRKAREIAESNYYSMIAPSWEVARVLDGKLTWEDFSLTFRMRLSREPDVYQTLIQGFLIMEPEDLNHFCAKLLDIESKQERIVVEAGGCRYSVNRYCPHQGGDLTEGSIEAGRYLVCARHRWRFDLHQDGRCESSSDSVDAVALEGD